MSFGIKLKLTLLCLLLSSCGKIPHDIDSYFLPFLDQFGRDTQSHNISEGAIDDLTVIKFSDSLLEEKNDEGYCYYEKEYDFLIPINMFKQVHKEITIDSSVKKYEFMDQYILFLHEMGHCVYHLSHSNDPDNIMYHNWVYPKIPISQAMDNYFEEARVNKSQWGSDTQPP